MKTYVDPFKASNFNYTKIRTGNTDKTYFKVDLPHKSSAIPIVLTLKGERPNAELFKKLNGEMTIPTQRYRFYKNSMNSQYEKPEEGK